MEKYYSVFVLQMLFYINTIEYNHNLYNKAIIKYNKQYRK